MSAKIAFFSHYDEKKENELMDERKQTGYSTNINRQTSEKFY